MRYLTLAMLQGLVLATFDLEDLLPGLGRVLKYGGITKKRDLRGYNNVIVQ